MKMKVFEIVGEYKKKGEIKKFTAKTKAQTHKYASDKAMCLIGSRHKVKRRDIVLKEVKEAGEENDRNKGN